MELQDQELLKRLIEENEVFKKTYMEHRDYDQRLAKLEKKSCLNSNEKAELARLKKLKLALKDEMQTMLSGQRGART